MRIKKCTTKQEAIDFATNGTDCDWQTERIEGKWFVVADLPNGEISMAGFDYDVEE